MCYIVRCEGMAQNETVDLSPCPREWDNGPVPVSHEKRGKEMARKETISKEMILNTAFQMAREEGLKNITARRVADRAGCSTQPIFRGFENMDDLTDGVYEKAVVFFQDYIGLYPRLGRAPFSNLGMAYIAFAREEKELFRMLFVPETQKKSLYEILNGKNDSVKNEIQEAAAQGCKDPSALFMKLWIFIHGAATMSLTGDYDLSDQETLEMLESVCQAFMIA